MGQFLFTACTAVREAHRAVEVAHVGDFDDAEAGVLHVVGAQSAVIGTTVLHRHGEVVGHFGRFDVEFTALAVVVSVVHDEHPFCAVGGTPFVHIDVVIFEKDFGFDGVKAGGADG